MLAHSILGRSPFSACDALLDWSSRETKERYMDPDRPGYISPTAVHDPNFRYVDNVYTTIRSAALAEFWWDTARHDVDPEYEDPELLLTSCRVVQQFRDAHRQYWMDLSREFPHVVIPNDIDAVFDRDELTDLCRHLSLCPIHFVDWAICFDDEDPGCFQVRLIYPRSHDT